MAGITGAIALGAQTLQAIELQTLEMICALKAEPQQTHAYYQDDVVFISAVPTLGIAEQNQVHIEQKLGIVCAIDGFVNVFQETSSNLSLEYGIASDMPVAKFISYAYAYYGDEVCKHLTGSFNVFIYDTKNRKALLFNDRFGLYPMYYGIVNNVLLFGSKINALLSSGSYAKASVDVASIFEHLQFGYVISDHSYINGIRTMANAEMLCVKNGNLKQHVYWSIKEDFASQYFGFNDSFDAINAALKKSIHDLVGTSSRVLLSVTGGWDSRVVLSYLLPDYRESLSCYSFGAAKALDITIPELICKSEGLEYRPFALNQDYLGEHFVSEAKNTIELSSGTRNYKRTHYLYALKQICTQSPVLLTGIFGDEVFKPGKPMGGSVLSPKVIGAIETGFDPELVIANCKSNSLLSFFGGSDSACFDSLYSRFDELKSQYREYGSVQEKYVAFRFQHNLRKYFGNEASSYNDYVICHSPFIDYEFVRTWLSTKYAGNRYPFSKPSLGTKRKSTELYAKLIYRNYSPLAYYPTARGYNMADSMSIFGMYRIARARYLKKERSGVDGFFTKSTDSIFAEYLMRAGIEPLLDVSNTKQDAYSAADALSLSYWLNCAGVQRK